MSSPENICTAVIQYGKRKGETCGKETWRGTNACWGHQPKEVKEEVGFGGAQEGSGRPRIPRPSELIIQKLEQRAEELADKILQIAIEGSKTVVVPGGRDDPGFTEEVEDQQLQLRATQYAIDHLIGKAVQRNELVGGGEPVQIDLTPSDEKARKIAQAIKESGGL